MNLANSNTGYVQAGKVSDENRRTPNYKPNIWKYDVLEAVANEYADKKYEMRFNELINGVKGMFSDTPGTLAKLELIENTETLGLGYIFQHEIFEALQLIASIDQNQTSENNLYATALAFTLLRQHGYQVSQDMFIDVADSSRKLIKIDIESDVKGMLKLHEASHLALENENILDEMRDLALRNLQNVRSSNVDDTFLAKTVSLTLQQPYRLEWYNVKRQIFSYEKDNKNSLLLNLAKLNFNIIQATHQKELKEITRWWRNLGIAESLSFTRNRIAESYLWAVGVAFESEHGSFRKWLAKAIMLITVIDDVYDVYGTLQESETFTNAVCRWDVKGTQDLPECMKICFKTLYDTTNETAYEIEKEKGWDSVLPLLQKVWEDFCKALLVEAEWYYKTYTPSVQEYLDNGWISSSGPILSLYSLLAFTHVVADGPVKLLETTRDLVYNASLIIRLCNDLGTSAAELERGDVPTSIICLMTEKDVSEEVARAHIRSLTINCWKKINNECVKQPAMLQPFVKRIKNIARVAQFIYHNGDGFGNPDRETRDKVYSLLMEPLPLD